METTLAAASVRQKWISKYFAEYVRNSKFLPYIGRSAMSIIVAKYELQEESGKTINIPLITRLKGTGVTGSQVLDGNEEELGNYNYPISVEWRRHGVRIPKSTAYKTDIDLYNAGKDMLREWEAEQLRDDLIYAFYSVLDSVTTTANIRYGAITADATNGGLTMKVADYIATEAQKDAWLANNSDRVLFGAARANNSGNDHSASLSNVDSTADKLTSAIGSLAKRMAKAADPHIRPFKTKSGAEFFVMFCNSKCFRDLQTDTAMVNANRDARPRNVEDNPLFQDGNLILNGVLYVEVEEIPTIQAAGNGSIDVAGNFLCGLQTAGIAWGQEPTPRQDNTKDYQFRPGVAIEELLGVQKLFFNGKQHGCVTVYCSATPDT
jgi:N4-gp56 family major capsid protein